MDSKSEQPNQTDTIALRHALVEHLKQHGAIRSPAVEAAFRAVPRHLFLPTSPLDLVYQDQAIPTKQLDGQIVSSSSQPAIMAIMLEQLDLQPGQRVLEIGTGTGYNAALMAHIVGTAGQVVTLDIDDDLVRAARERLIATGFDWVQVVCRDGVLGYHEAALYDRIILTVAAWDIAPAWRDQLHSNGRLVLPLSLGGPQKSVAFVPQNDHLDSVSVVDCGFMRLRGAFTGPERRIQLGPDPHLTMEVFSSQSPDPDTVYNLITQPYTDVATPLSVTFGDLFGPAWLWLVFHHLAPFVLQAAGPLVQHEVIPHFFAWSGPWKLTFTHAFVDTMSLCTWTLPPGTTFAADDSAWSVSFPLHIRVYGEDTGLAQQLVTCLSEWDRAGRPKSSEMRIRAYTHAHDSTLQADEYLIPKQWSNLIITQG